MRVARAKSGDSYLVFRYPKSFLLANSILSPSEIVFDEKIFPRFFGRFYPLYIIVLLETPSYGVALTRSGISKAIVVSLLSAMHA